MSTEEDAAARGRAAWQIAETAAQLLAVDPAGLAGVRVCAAPGPARDAWFDEASALWPTDTPIRRSPVDAAEGRLIGGIDLGATLSEGRLVEQRGLLADADDGILVVRMADRMDRSAAAHIAAALDQRCVHVERSGISRVDPARFGLVLFDESAGPGEGPPELLLERVGLQVDLHSVSIRDIAPFASLREDIADARAILDGVTTAAGLAEDIAKAGLMLGVASLRSLGFVLRAARALAALGGRDEVGMTDAAAACQLVYGPRAAPPDPEAPPPEPPPPPSPSEANQQVADGSTREDVDMERLVEAVESALASGALDALRPERRSARSSGEGRSGAELPSSRQGRPRAARRGDPRRDGRLDLMGTLQAAAPWQKLRPRTGGAQVAIRADDFRVKRFKTPAASTVIFVVDASGSSAMHRMAEAKGAVELLLSDCYARRDCVALITFRGEGAEIAVAPTRSLVMARRRLTGLRGGGATPLAAGIVAASVLAKAEHARGRTPFLVFLSDGRGNIALDGARGADAAREDAVSAARRLRAEGYDALFFDISTRPSHRARALSAEMGAAYRPLPFADAGVVSRSVRRAMQDGA
ncbi:MAG: magnesium chelatase subunit D [Pseudomonadota bacterium]